jgi:hypothetical protein
MTRSWLAALLLLGCAHAEPAMTDAPATAAPVTATAAPIATAVSPPATGIGRILLPPSEAGAHRTVVEGCALSPREPPPATRAVEAPESFATSALGTGIIVSHTLPHACCLEAKTAVVVTGPHVTITETLSGTPCRCRCTSTIKTAVGLTRGTWAVAVKTVDPAGSREAWSGDLVVK